MTSKLDTLDTRITALRNQASNLREQYQHAVLAIQNDATLTLIGKNERIRALTDPTDQLNALKAQEGQLIQDVRLALERSIGGSITTQVDVIGFRDAQDRAAQIADDSAGTDAMTIALRNNDDQLAKAILMHAITQGFPNTVNTYAATNPNAEQDINDLFSLNQRTNSISRTFHKQLAYVNPVVI